MKRFVPGVPLVLTIALLVLTIGCIQIVVPESPVSPTATSPTNPPADQTLPTAPIISPTPSPTYSPTPTPTPYPSPTTLIPSALPEIQFAANPDTIIAGEVSTLSWAVINSSSVIINPPVLRTLGPIPPVDSTSVSPPVTTTYTLTATNSSGSRFKTVIVNVISAPVTPEALGWTGTWDTNWGTMYLTQSTGKVTGTYEYDDGKITGSISKNLLGNELWGTWSEAPSYSPPDDAGDIEFIMDPDFNSFTGKWRYGSSGDWSGSWKGTRISSKVLIIE